MDTEAKTTGLRYRIGMICIVLAFISPVFALLVPILGLSDGMTTTLVGLFLVGGPEVFLVLGAALAGKQGVDIIKGKCKALLGMAGPSRPVGRMRYRVGLTILVGSILANWAFAYISQTIETGLAAGTVLAVTFILDLITLASFFVLGGQFWQKLRHLFTWEPKSEDSSTAATETT